MNAYYNENDPKAAAWLRELISAGAIAKGDVDERDIRLVQPSDLRSYTQCHFFAGIGGWSYALRLAGWTDDRPVWTGSCPCQPFSAAGKKEGHHDERHLWPAWFRLIRECAPTTIFGEQVAGPDGLAWFDLVSTDLETQAYAVAAADLCAAGVGAPHIRQRLYFVANAAGARCEGIERLSGPASREVSQRDSEARDMANTTSGGRGIERRQSEPRHERHLNIGGTVDLLADASGGFVSQPKRGSQERDGFRPASEIDHSAMADADGGNGSNGSIQRGGQHGFEPKDGRVSFWSDADWLECSDGKRRPVKPGTFPLVTGLLGRMALLRGAGNAIVPQVAAEFIKAYEAIT